MKSILWFYEISKSDVGKVGGKGANLGEMTQAGFPVPPGFCVTAQVYFHFLEKANLKRKISQLLKGLDVNKTEDLNQISSQIKEAIVKAEIPEAIKKEIIKAYEKLSKGKDIYVAVRSSATAEDLPEASFAGQQVTFLNIWGQEDLLKAVQGCWASLFEPRAIFYRQEKGYDHLKVGIAVPVQQMIQSDVSGVMFTVDPVTSDQTKVTIEAGFGLGEAIVSGSITPDRYLVDKKTFEILEKDIASQSWAIVLESGENKHLSIPKKNQKLQKLSDDKIVELAKIGAKIEAHYGFPQDIEWAFSKGKIYIVQTRPVTTIRKAKAKKEKILPKAKIILKGIGASFGLASGPVRVVPKAQQINLVKKGDILVTGMTTPDFVPAMRRASAIVTDKGGRTSHAAIVSRELGIPCVVGTEKATTILKDNQIITVDGARGLVFEGKLELKEEIPKSERVVQARVESPITATKIYVNLAEPERALEIAKLDVDGVGLLRAEFMISEIGVHPRKLIKEGKSQKFVDNLVSGLEQFASAFHPRPVVYRASDFKTNEYRNLKGGKEFEAEEANPMIGYRGCFRYIKEPDLFNLELEAIKNGRQKYKNLHLMIPFLRTYEEFLEVKKLVEASGLFKDKDFKFWIMVEVPSCYFLIEKYCRSGIDGVSIGSNDLTQLILGIDRDSEVLEEIFDERNEAVLSFIKHIIDITSKYNVTCSICGQAPSFYPELTENLVRWGITSISVNPDVINQTRRLVASVERKLILQKIKEIQKAEKFIKKELEAL